MNDAKAAEARNELGRDNPSVFMGDKALVQSARNIVRRWHRGEMPADIAVGAIAIVLGVHPPVEIKSEFTLVSA